MVLSNWHIGREIVEYVQRGETRAGEEVIEDLSRQLKERVGRGYSSTNLRYFRTFYVVYRDRRPEIRQMPSGEFTDGFSPRLSWSHYQTLCKVEQPEARAFYEIEAERENWPVEHLERQVAVLADEREQLEPMRPLRRRSWPRRRGRSRSSPPSHRRRARR